jgi:hypothetical protein
MAFQSKDRAAGEAIAVEAVAALPRVAKKKLPARIWRFSIMRSLR